MDKVSYALGVSVGQQLAGSGVKNLNIEDFVDGIKTIFEEKELKLSPEEGNDVLNEYFTRLRKIQEEEAKKIANLNKEVGKKYMEKNKENGYTTTNSGLQYKIITKVEGDKKKPGPHSRVKCHYEGRLIDGRIFDSSYVRNEPAVFSLDQVISGWTEGLQLMGVGDKYEFTIPSELGYGEVGVPGHIQGGSVLIFTVELLDIVE